jgi:hypothetical protein
MASDLGCGHVAGTWPIAEENSGPKDIEVMNVAAPKAKMFEHFVRRDSKIEHLG